MMIWLVVMILLLFVDCFAFFGFVIMLLWSYGIILWPVVLDMFFLGGGMFSVPVKLRTPCMLRHSQGWGWDANVPVNLLTPCMLRHSQGLGGC